MVTLLVSLLGAKGCWVPFARVTLGFRRVRSNRRGVTAARMVMPLAIPVRSNICFWTHKDKRARFRTIVKNSNFDGNVLTRCDGTI